MRAIAILVAGGRGVRAGGDGPKQWQPLAGRRVADWTVDAFVRHRAINGVVVVHHPDDTDQTALLPGGITLAVGGSSRAESVQNGLRAAAALRPDIVLIHDMARPCVSAALIWACIQKTIETGAAAPAVPVTDALWAGNDGQVQGPRSRDGLFRAQTPQCFDYQKLVAAHAHADPDAADDVAVAQSAGMQVAIVAGSEDNIKITYPDDFARAERIMGHTMKLRVGNGYDVHKFGPGTDVILCGVQIPHTASLMGHSDADVSMHAVTDALYGALADGDIGQHFPPSDPQWKGAASDIFLKHAVARVAAAGFEVANVDCTIVCEYPKIGPHAPAMRAKMAELMGLDIDQVSVKATTSEKLGFTGREEGIASIATVALVGVSQ